MRVRTHVAVLQTRTWPARSPGLGRRGNNWRPLEGRRQLEQPPSCKRDTLPEDVAQELDLRRTAAPARALAVYVHGTHTPTCHPPTVGPHGGKSGEAPPPLTVTSRLERQMLRPNQGLGALAPTPPPLILGSSPFGEPQSLLPQLHGRQQERFSMFLMSSLMIFELKLLRPGPKPLWTRKLVTPQLSQLQSAPGEVPSRLTALPKGPQAAWAGGQRGSWLTFASEPEP